LSDPQPLYVQQMDTAPRGAEGDAVFTFKDGEGRSVSVDLSASMQNILVSLVLSAARARVEDGQVKLPRPPIRAYAFRPFVLSDDMAGLEVQIHDELALHIAFDGATYGQLATAVRVLAPPDGTQRDTTAV
jgi:hypothetical protein